MTTTEERMTILRMIEAGQITAEEGARLLSALDRATDEQAKAPNASHGAARYLRVRVTDAITGQQKVGVNVPLALVSFGLRFVPENAKNHVQPIQEAIEAGHLGRVVEVFDEQERQRVEIFIE